MRLSLVRALLVLAGGAALAAPAMAEYGVAYYGLRGSYVITDGGETQGLTYDYNEEYADGFAAAIYIGWVLDDAFRLEMEGGYRSADIDEVTIVRDLSGVYNAGDVVDAGGDAQLGTAMVNLYYDIHIADGPILPWIGAGIGAAFVDYEIDDPSDPTTFNGQDTTWVFAYQFMAGITFPIDDGISMSMGYTFFQTQDFVYENVYAEEQETDLTQHSVDLGIQFHL